MPRVVRCAGHVVATLALGLGCTGAGKDDIPPPVQLDSTGIPVAAALPPPAPADSAPAEPLSLTEMTWELRALGDGSPPPPGAGGRRATIRFESASTRVAGFAGCNRYSGSYVRGGGDTLRLGAIATTRMACPDGEPLERVLLGILPRVTTVRLTDTSLVLSGQGAPLAHWAPQALRGRSAAELAR